MIELESLVGKTVTVIMRMGDCFTSRVTGILEKRDRDIVRGVPFYSVQIPEARMAFTAKQVAGCKDGCFCPDVVLFGYDK